MLCYWDLIYCHLFSVRMTGGPVSKEPLVRLFISNIVKLLVYYLLYLTHSFALSLSLSLSLSVSF